MQKIYLDNAATTPLLDEVIDSMVHVMRDSFGNPSSTHSFGQDAKNLIEATRKQIASDLKVQPNEIIFTSCGTESNNLIIKSCVDYLGVTRIISSPLEHKCVAEACLDMKMKGVELVYLKPNNQGDIDLGQLEQLLANSDKKTLVSLVHANNEVGNIIDLDALSQLCKAHKAYLHSDTVQTIGHLPLDFSKTMVDFASCSAHKFHGPKGIGFAFIRKTTGMKGQILGGGQERNLRAGTENVAGIVGMGKALEICTEHMAAYAQHIQEIKDYTIAQFQANIPGVKFNGRSAEKENSLYTLLSVLLPYKNPLLSLQLDMKGVAISQGSACSSGAASVSMVMMMVLSQEEISNGTPMRLSFSHKTTKADIDVLIKALLEIAAEGDFS
jgi:cysteine desulfurase